MPGERNFSRAGIRVVQDRDEAAVGVLERNVLDLAPGANRADPIGSGPDEAADMSHGVVVDVVLDRGGLSIDGRQASIRGIGIDDGAAFLVQCDVPEHDRVRPIQGDLDDLGHLSLEGSPPSGRFGTSFPLRLP